MQGFPTDPSPIANDSGVLAVSRTNTRKNPPVVNTPEILSVNRRHSLKNELPKLSVKQDAYYKVSNYMNYPNNRVKQDMSLLASYGYEYAQHCKKAHLTNTHKNVPHPKSRKIKNKRSSGNNPMENNRNTHNYMNSAQHYIIAESNNKTDSKRVLEMSMRCASPQQPKGKVAMKNFSANIQKFASQ